MHDTHCHLDLYQDPSTVANSTEQAAILTIAVTNLPSSYFAARPHMGRFRFLKLAVGLHPMLTKHHTSHEMQLFKQAFEETEYIGEVGLDFSEEGFETRIPQISSFRFVLGLLQEQKKVVTVHSRRAESTILHLLDEYNVGPVIFHFYSGGLTDLNQIIDKGHFLSINPAMIQTKNGQRIIGRIPRERLLTETDGPFVTVNRRPAVPSDVRLIHEYLAARWKASVRATAERFSQNLVDFSNDLALEDPMGVCDGQ